MTPRDLVLGIDIGTGAAKVVLADAEGMLLKQSAATYTYSSPAPGYAEQEAEDWWRAVCLATRKLFAENPGAGDRIAAVGVSGQGVAAVFLDDAGKPLRPAILWLDRRSAANANELIASSGETIAAISGKPPGCYNFEPKLRWIQRHEASTWAKTWKVLTTTAYITYRLTGKIAVNHSDGGICLGYDLDRRLWSEELAQLMGLSISVYGELAECNSLVGTVTHAAARETGIAFETPVVAGGEDTSAAGLAMGVFTPEVAQLSLGTANTVNIPMPNAIRHPQLLAFPHVVPGLTLLGGSMSSGGLAIQWITKILMNGSCRADEVETLGKEAVAISPGAEGLIFLPYLAGELQPINDGDARGAFFGLDAEMGRAHLMRAVLEGTAMAIQHNLSLARAVGARPARLRAVGGPTRSRLLCQIIADATGLPMEVMSETSGAALGSAMLAAEGIHLSSFTSMHSAHARVIAAIEPDMRVHQIYQQMLQKYIQLYPSVKLAAAGTASNQVHERIGETSFVHLH